MKHTGAIIRSKNGQYLKEYNNAMDVVWTKDITQAYLECYDFDTRGILDEFVDDGVGDLIQVTFEIVNVTVVDVLREVEDNDNED